MSDIGEEAFQQAISVLHSLKTPQGFIAARTERANYHRVFSRDSMIAGLAAIATGQSELIDTMRASLLTLAETQHRTGRIVSNTTLDLQGRSYGQTVGRVDATIWFVVGACQYYLHTHDEEAFGHLEPHVRSAVDYLDCLELNGRGLIYVPPGADWADEYLLNGYVLYDQILYYLALQSYRRALNENGELAEKTDKLKNVIALNYFPEEQNIDDDGVYHRDMFARSLVRHTLPTPITSLYQVNIVLDHIDNMANSLLMATDIIDQPRKQLIAEYVYTKLLGDEALIPAFHPTINENDPEYAFLKANHLYGFRNQPHEYHNGGEWPVVHGLFVSTMPQRDQADQMVESFAKFLSRDDFSFSEYYHGRTQEPGGVAGLGMSAAGFVMAYQTTKDGRFLFV